MTLRIGVYSVHTSAMSLGKATHRSSSHVRLPSIDHPANEPSDDDTQCERHRGRFDGVALHPLSRIIHEFFGGIAAPFYGTFYNVYAVVDRLCHRRCCA